MRTLHILIAMSIASGGVACSVLVGFDGFVGGQTNDAGSANDARANDAAILDGGADGPFCQSAAARNAAFCDDFDESADASPFTMIYQYPTSAPIVMVDVVSDEAASEPSSLAISLTAGRSDPSNGRFAFAGTAPLADVTTSLQWSFDLRIDAIDQGYSPFLAGITFGTASVNYTVSLFSGAQGAGLQEGVPDVSSGDMSYVDWPASALLPTGTWTHVEIDVDFAKQTLALVDDGVNILTHSLSSGNSPGVASFVVGVGYYIDGSVVASRIHVDDALVVAH